jgi:DNA polymerase-3 subunit epsilon
MRFYLFQIPENEFYNMKLNLKKNIVFFDVETTGLSVIKDRILQIALIKYFADGKEPEELTMLINPSIPISEEAMSIHGITPKDLANKPTFMQVAQKIYDFIGNADLGGYNSNRFDIPMLMEEFARAGLDFEVNHRKLIDVQRIFYRMEPRTLKAAVRYYCGKEMEDAHDALEDIRATVDVFKGQLAMYEGKDYQDEDGNWVEQPIKNDMVALHEFTNDVKIIDATQRLKYDMNGVIVFNFGKYLNQPVLEVLLKDKQYYHWMLEKDFSVQVKKLIKQLVSEAGKKW